VLTEEENIRALMHQMHERANHAPWALSAEDIRSERRRRVPDVPNPKILGLVAAAIIVIVLVVLVGTGVGSGGHKVSPAALPPLTTTTAPSPPSTTTTTNGAPRVTVPELLGESQAEAESSLANLGLMVGQIHLAPNAVATGTVIAQAPSAGSLVAPGSVVIITLSSGPSSAAAYGTSATSGELYNTEVESPYHGSAAGATPSSGPADLSSAANVGAPDETSQDAPESRTGVVEEEGTNPIPEPVAVPGSQPPSSGPSPLQAPTAPAALPYPAIWGNPDDDSSHVSITDAQTG